MFLCMHFVTKAGKVLSCNYPPGLRYSCTAQYITATEGTSCNSKQQACFAGQFTAVKRERTKGKKKKKMRAAANQEESCRPPRYSFAAPFPLPRVCLIVKRTQTLSKSQCDVTGSMHAHPPLPERHDKLKEIVHDQTLQPPIPFVQIPHVLRRETHNPCSSSKQCVILRYSRCCSAVHHHHHTKCIIPCPFR